MRLGSILGSPTDRMGLMLVPNQEGLLVGRKQQMLDGVIPSEQEYGSAPVYRERTWTCRPTGGYGERVQSAFGDRRYYWGMDIQVSGGLFGKGPLLHPIVPTASGTVRKFIDGLNGSTVTQFTLTSAGVFRRDNDTNAGQVKESAGNAMDGVLFQGGFSGATASLYLAFSGGSIWERTPANVYSQATLPAGFAPERLEVVGTELWAADINTSVIRKVTADPKVAANWSGPILVGNPSSKISAIRQTGNVLVIFKEDGGLFTVNSDGSVNDLFPGARVPPNSENGYRAAAWLNALWFRAGPTFYRLDMPGAGLTPIGPGRMLDNASPVRGEMRTFCGWGGYQAFATIRNTTDNVAYLMSHGSWEPQRSEQGTSFEFQDQWDGALAHWDGRTPTAMYVSAASGTDRLYVGFADGGWDWIKLVQNPLATGSGAEFTLGPSELILPLHHAMFQADVKHWLGFSLFGPVVRLGDEATLYYRLSGSAGGISMDPTGDWLELGEFFASGQRIPAPSNLAGNALQLKVALANETTASTPVIEIIALHERVVPTFKRDVSGTVDARNFVTRLDGAVVRPNADVIHRAMMEFAATPGSLAIELPDETVSEVAIFGYRERMLPMQAGGGRGWAIDFEATQFRVLTVYGIIRRLRGTRIGDLRGYDIGSLRTL
jgi:hypothetical protein